ncbi:MAG: HAAS signaling domain-containing protein [Phycicoccus sp.]
MNTSDARVGSYLDDLARMLADLEPSERDDVLAGVREHLDAVVTERPDDPRALGDALLRLGPPERVASEARATSVGTAVPMRWDPGSRAWAGAAVLAVGVSTAPLLGLLGAVTGASILANGDTLVVDQLYLSTWQILGSTMWTTPIWLVGLIGVAVSPHLQRQTRALVIACGPAALVTRLLFEPLLTAETQAVLPFLLVGVAIMITVACRRAWQEVRS